MSREVPGYNAITCDCLQELGLWDTKYCCPECHEDHPTANHRLRERRISSGQILAVLLHGSHRSRSR
jgi:hypothetical protein